MYNFSVIIPHHNIPDLLRRALDSIPKRPDVQVIVVDDNSDPDKVNFDCFPGSGEPNTVVVFDKSGRRQGHTRNIGIEMAEGKWLLFLDADDYFTYGVRTLLDKYVDSEADVVYFNAISLDTDSYLPSQRVRHVQGYHKLYGHNPLKAEAQLRYEFGEPWCKMIKRECVVKYALKFEEYSMHEETRFSYLLGFYAKQVAVDNTAAYCVTDRAGSASRNYTEENRIVEVRVFGERELFLRRNNIKGCCLNWHWRMLGWCLTHNLKLYKEAKSELLQLGFGRWEVYGHSVYHGARELLKRILGRG